ncbi:cytochrome P450 [Aspergillus costaricaensis CBS 115574]|uniref:Cytochrome P450 n=1 Tax=Aspergillus costaricaensis CBS 115574 TaxID=1448317 RepID=A0ACD1IL64_9EURO|nr:cytochrome P450 [Aspergillus costaricaensis CBS 115574]RAK90845.1 cytochrome P450 [Aspergillus costaricaensis CBS 115574]
MEWTPTDATLPTEIYVTYLIIATIGICLMNYWYGIHALHEKPRVKRGMKIPPLVPSLIPPLGTFPIKMLWNPRGFVLSAKHLLWNSRPVRARILTQTLYIFQGTETIGSILKERSLSLFAVHAILLRRVFGLPPSALRIYAHDNSGGFPRPYPESNVKPQNRIEYLIRHTNQRLLLGAGFAPFVKRFQSTLTERLQALSIRSHWVELDDFVQLFNNDFTASMMDALCGKYLIRQHPNFAINLFTLDDNIWKMLVGVPRFLAPRAYAARDAALGALKDWNTWAQEHFDPAAVDSDGDDPVWGSKYWRDRVDAFQQIEGFDADVIAMHDLAVIWGMTTNGINTSFWTCLEAFKDQELLNLVRAEARACLISESDVKFDIDRLLHQPVLQAIYAETLRLRINGFFVWYQSHGDLNVDGWHIPNKNWILTTPMSGHMDPEIWCRGAGADHPVEDFWVGRWLKYADDGQTLIFTTEMAKGAWMPYGGALHVCPGRYFAKTMIILGMALMTRLYDCEVLADEKNLRMSMRTFGFGTVGPVGKVPVRIRRRVL